eukprot:jgi/Botrbrau1/4437/Bobra.0348s0026.1
MTAYLLEVRWGRGKPMGSLRRVGDLTAKTKGDNQPVGGTSRPDSYQGKGWKGGGAEDASIFRQQSEVVKKGGQPQR